MEKEPAAVVDGAPEGPASPPPADPGPPGAAPSPAGEVVRRLDAIEERLRASDERARHREAVIDRLHAENQELKAGERRSVLDPVVTDVIGLYDQLSREACGLRSRGDAKTADLLDSLADDALLALERIGVEPVEARIGDPFRAELHRPLSAIDDTDPDRANTIARITAQGFRDAATGRVRRKVQAHFYRLATPPADEPAAP